MKILLVSQEYPPESSGTGIGTQTGLKARGLARRGHTVHVICSTYSGATGATDEHGVTVHRLPHPSIDAPFSELSVQWIGYSWAVGKKVYELLGMARFDVIEFPEYAAEGFCYQVDAYQYHHVPIVVMLHGSLAMFAERIGWPEPESELFRIGGMAERVVVERADKLVAASRNIADFWRRRLAEEKQDITVIHTSVDAERFRPVEDREPGRPTVLFVGRVDAAKGVLAVADAVLELRSRYPDILFRVVGTGDEDNERQLQERVSLSPENFELLGSVPHSELAPRYQGCHVFASPAAEEHGVASVYLEALSSGKPVIACNSGGAPEAVIDGKTGLLVPPGSHDELVSSLDRLLSDRALREELGSNGRRLVLAHFAEEKFLDRVEAVYEEVIIGHRGHRRDRLSPRRTG
jgi:glycosyltransferase involved in cell wall biosynthesis